MGRSVLRPGLLDEPRHLPDRALLLAGGVRAGQAPNALAGDDAVTAHLVSGNGGHGYDRSAAVLARDLGHADAHLATGNEIVAEKDEERLLVDGVGSLENGVPEAASLILIDKGHRQRGRRVHAVRLRGLAALAQHGLKGLVRREVLLDLRLLMRVDDDGAVHALGLQSLLDHILDDGLVYDRKQLLGSALRGGEKAGSEAGGRDDCLH